jgi:predicted transcriptional regulator of viral defense system
MSAQSFILGAAKAGILKRMVEGEEEAIYFPSDFEDLGTPEAVRAALSRLAKDGSILRLGQGIYQYPKRQGLLGALRASAEAVAEAIAKRDGARIMPAGAYALNKLGLSTQVPMKLVYLTDGAPRLIKVGRSTILFKRAIPRKLAVKGKVNQLVIQALSALGKERVTAQNIELIYKALEREEDELIQKDSALAPAWIRQIMKQYLESKTHKWLELSHTEQEQVFIQAADVLGVSAESIEKDFWVTVVLQALFSMPIAHQIVFKGGTSLSKGWSYLERFSEDIDIGMDRELLGFSGSLSKSQVKKLREKSGPYVSNEFKTMLEQSLRKLGFSSDLLSIDAEQIPEDRPDIDPLRLYVQYPSVMRRGGYLRDKVVIEVSSRSELEPSETRTLGSMVAKAFQGTAMTGNPFEAKLISPSRTFLEKMILLHEEFSKPEDKIRTERMSRHLYDIERLASTEHGKQALNDHMLFESIVKHRKLFTPVNGINYDTLNLHSLSFLPPEKLMAAWASDYSAMQEAMFYGTSLSFEHLMSRLRIIQDTIKSN